MWDENFFGVQYKEADYWIRALIFNKDGSCINDTLHGLELNNENALELDTTVDRNFVEEEGFAGPQTLKRKADDAEHIEIQRTRGGIYKQYMWKYFYEKWSGTWKEEPTKNGWVKQWSKEFIDNPPDIMLSKQKTIIRYIYFEKDVYDLPGKNYLI
jgi:hypothetical protein